MFIYYLFNLSRSFSPSWVQSKKHPAEEEVPKKTVRCLCLYSLKGKYCPGVKGHRTPEWWKQVVDDVVFQRWTEAAARNTKVLINFLWNWRIENTIALKCHVLFFWKFHHNQTYILCSCSFLSTDQDVNIKQQFSSRCPPCGSDSKQRGWKSRQICVTWDEQKPRRKILSGCQSFRSNVANIHIHGATVLMIN